jgi:hypothetical protein
MASPLSSLLYAAAAAIAVTAAGALLTRPRAPKARPPRRWVDMMSDGVMVLDREGSIVYRNRTARDMLHLDGPALAGALRVRSLQEAPVEWRGESLVDDGEGRRWLDIRVGPVVDSAGEVAGRIVVARDVTVQKALEDERERLIDELQEALQSLVNVDGMLPICAHCRNVRDDRGSWSRLEDYISSRTSLEFTHAICPDCMEDLYPEIAAPSDAAVTLPDTTAR